MLHSNLDRQTHDGVDYISVVLLKCLDSLPLADTSLCHDKLNILLLNSLSVNLTLLLVFLLSRLSILSRTLALTLSDSLADLGLHVTTALLLLSLCGHLHSSVLLGLAVQVLDLGLAEDDPAVGGRRLVDLGVGNDEEDVLRAAESHTRDAGDGLEAELLESLAGLLLVTGVDLNTAGASGEACRGVGLVSCPSRYVHFLF
jgi:hypothetical protein